MFESRHHTLATRAVFLRRVLLSLVLGFLLVVVSLAVGMWGYWHYEGLSCLDAYLNAAMILSGMGPLHNPATVGGKAFAGTYALYSGLVVILVTGIIFAPVVHRFFHHFHLEDEADKP
ncbi:hypothetical protein [Parvibium lacunae]|uniref:Two pore domain potassium channel family protein n=1 Tax=Parvibium lacunae TaxID=1888893 RepID=A0A368L7D8_9BURK|nr:hypothetical protein [Parvibium lacunae]RCS59524.1 hypothetical protein DU000_02010 [Parvibium lacunae]